jgi:hypothetical protein
MNLLKISLRCCDLFRRVLICSYTSPAIPICGTSFVLSSNLKIEQCTPVIQFDYQIDISLGILGLDVVIPILFNPKFFFLIIYSVRKKVIPTSSLVKTLIYSPKIIPSSNLPVGILHPSYLYIVCKTVLSFVSDTEYVYHKA